jgi:FkbM family methyltransferase
MSLPELVTIHNLKINGVLHVGAHLAEEAAIYDTLDVGNVWWIEANPRVLGKIKTNLLPYPNQTLLHALVYSEDGVELNFNVTNYEGMSSSIFEFGTHPEFSPDTKFIERIRLLTRTIDSLADQHHISANLLNMDLQGAELLALQGASRFLDGVDYIMTEVNQDEVYVDCAQVEQLDEHLTGFRRVQTYWVPGQGWGDALYVRRPNR